MRYVVTFLQSIEKLLNGTLEGNPSQNGQTSEEEKAQDGTLLGTFFQNITTF